MAIQLSKTFLFFTHHPKYIERRPFVLAKLLSEKGYKIKMFVPCERIFSLPSRNVINENFCIYNSPVIFPGSLKHGVDPVDLLYRIYKGFALEYDLIYAFDTRPTVILPSSLFKYIAKKKIVIDWTDWFGKGGTINERGSKLYKFLFEKIETFFEEYFFRFADGATVINPKLTDRLLKLRFKKKIYFFPLGCNSVTSLENSNKTKRELHLPEDLPILGCVGTLFQRDAELLFLSMEELRKKSNYKLLLIGQNPLLKKYSLPNNIIYTGFISKNDLIKYISACDIMLMPLCVNISNNGRWPSKINDYISAEKPIISTKTYIVNELYSRHPFCRLADDNPEDFSQKIIELINDKNKQEILVSECKKLKDGFLNWDKIVDNLEMEFLNKIIN